MHQGKLSLCFVVQLLAPLVVVSFSSASVSAQALAPNMPDKMIAEPGQTKTNNISSGSRSSLTIGSSSSFGSSSSISATSGVSSSSTATMAPASGSFSSNFGGSNGIIKVQVNNLRSTNGSGNITGDGFNINSSTANASQGSASSEGLSSQIQVVIDPSKTQTAATVGTLQSNNQASSTAKSVEGMGTGNASANHNMQNMMNVDISNTDFSNAFSQSF